MVVEQHLLPYFTWMIYGGENDIGALPRFLITVLAAAVIALVVGYLVALVRYGPLKAGDLTYRVVTGGLADLGRLSARRIAALARLAVKESIRRRVVVALVLFLLILLFASWFLKTDYRDPAKLYLEFVLTATRYLILMVALLLSAFSLPGEFKSKNHLHDRDQASAGRRYRPGTHCWFWHCGDGDARGDGNLQLYLRGSGARSSS